MILTKVTLILSMLQIFIFTVASLSIHEIIEKRILIYIKSVSANLWVLHLRNEALKFKNMRILLLVTFNELKFYFYKSFPNH